MNIDEMTTMVDEMFEGFSNGDIDKFGVNLAPDIVYEESSEMPPIEGREAFKDYANLWIKCSSDRQLRPIHKLGSADEMVIQLHYAGTHDGDEMYGLPATGKQMYFDAALWLTFSDGKICKLKAFFNPLQLMGHIGAT